MAAAITEPREVDDDLYVKFLMLYNRWLAVDDIPENQEEIKHFFSSQVQPKKTIWYVIGLTFYAYDDSSDALFAHSLAQYKSKVSALSTERTDKLCDER